MYQKWIKILALYVLYKRIERRRESRNRVSNRNLTRRRAYTRLMTELRNDDAKFMVYCKMPQKVFDELLKIIRDDIGSKHISCRRTISPELKLVLTLRFLTTGESFESLHFFFRVGTKVVEQSIYEVCTAIWKKLGPVEMAPPTTHTLKGIAKRFMAVWQFPNCLGAIDTLDVKFKSPNLSGNPMYDNKRIFSMVLQVVADADGLFRYVDTSDVTDYGVQSHLDVFSSSSFGAALTTNTLPLPQDSPPAPGCQEHPFVFLCGKDYPLLQHLMRPYPTRSLESFKLKENFNYKHSRVRRVATHALETMTSKWGAVKATLTVTAEQARVITLACCILHNFVRRREERGCGGGKDCQPTVEETSVNHSRLFGRPTQEALRTRDRFAELLTNDLLPMAS